MMVTVSLLVELWHDSEAGIRS